MKYKLIVFDLDGTLAKSKSLMDSEMASLLSKLLEKRKVAVMSGGSYKQYKKQFLASLNCTDIGLLKNLFLFPTCSTSFYRFEDDWKEVYSKKLEEHEKKAIFDAFDKVLTSIAFAPGEVFGEIIEDRGSQVTFSALGQEAPHDLKKTWDPDSSKRLEIRKHLKTHIPEFEIRVGGTTSIDVTHKGIDKAFGIGKIEEYLGISREEMLFIGDALFEGGNDYPVKQIGVKCISVDSPEDTKAVIKDLIKD